MRNMRSALWALGLAGAAYAWRNRAQLQQQLSQRRQGGMPRQLPNYGSEEERSTQEREHNWDRGRDVRFGGSDV